jgi:hypothetical protein
MPKTVLTGSPVTLVILVTADLSHARQTNHNAVARSNAQMNTAHLIAKLLEIEQAIGKIEPARVRGMVFEAEESVLQIEQQMIDILIENESLRQRMENCRPSSPSILTEIDSPNKFLIN